MRNLTWVQQRLFLELVQLLGDVIVQFVTDAIADVFEKQYKLTTLYMIRTAKRNTKKCKHSLFDLSESKPRNIFLTLEAIVAKAIFKSDLN